MLYAMEINSIEYDDVRQFCNQRLPEWTRIDYKVDFPNNLAKSISAYANTEGGILLMGVKTDASNRPTDICGVEYKRGLQERITSISNSNVIPPIIPEIQVCPFKSDSTFSEPDRAVIVVRVGQSYEAPHKIGEIVYVRIGGQCEPADPKTIEALTKRREKGKEVLQNTLESLIGEQGRLRRRELEDKLPCLSVIVCPLYPTKQIIEFNKESEKFLQKYPRELNFDYLHPSQNGLVLKSDFLKGYYAEITAEGLIVYCEPLREDIYIENLITVVGRVLEYSRGIFQRFGFHGKVLIVLRLNGAEGKELKAEPPKPLFCKCTFPKGAQPIEKIFSVDELVEKLDSAVTSIMIDFCRISGLRLNPPRFEKFVSSTLAENKK